MKKDIGMGLERGGLAGWTTKDFSLRELKKYLYKIKPPILEMSKDFIGGNTSIKKTYLLLEKYKKENQLIVSYAGTTDFVNCSDIFFGNYLTYISIQVSQAKFLNSTFFRIMIGGNRSSNVNILKRLYYFEKILTPVKILIEIHGGWESSIKNIKKIINETNYNFIIDFKNVLESSLSFQKLKNLIPKKRIEYYHSRNLIPDYIEDKGSISEEREWINKNEKNKVLWEPKLIEKEKIWGLIK